MKPQNIKKENFQFPVGDFLDVWIFAESISSTSALQKVFPFYGIEYKPKDIKKGQLGKPELKDGSLIFNFSNTAEKSILGICSSDFIGIDIEYINKKRCYTEAKKIILSFRELDVCRKNDDLFFKIWAMKESAAKYYGSSIWFGNKIKFNKKHITSEFLWLKHKKKLIWSSFFEDQYYISVYRKSKPCLFRFIFF